MHLLLIPHNITYLMIRRDKNEGVEKISQVLNDSFGGMIEAVESLGGDVVKFAGDALYCVWYPDESVSYRSPLIISVET